MNKPRSHAATQTRRPRWRLGRAVLVLALLPAAAAADDLVQPDVSRLRLRPQVEVRGDTVTLADVLSFTNADPRLAREIGARPVRPELRAPARTIVTHDQVVRRMDELGVNLARVLVSGAARCRVTLERAEAPPPRESPPSPARERGARESAPLFDAARASGETTLADALRDFITTELSSLGGTVEVEFERAGQEFLALTRPPWEFTIRARGGNQLGLREFEVVIRRDGRSQRTARVAARVKLVKRVLVARKPLGIGRFVRAEDVGFEQRIFDRAQDLGLDQTGPIIGQQARRYIPLGAMIRRSDLKDVDLVQRSRPVSVSSAGGHVRVRLTGVALDAGGYGDTVRVRIGESRKDRRILRGVVTGVGSVRLIEDGA